MRILAVLVFVFGVSAPVLAQEKPAELKHYRFAELKIELSFPLNWGIERLAENALMLSPGMEVWEDAVPPSPHPWLFVFEPEGSECSLDDRGQTVFNFSKGQADTGRCKSGVYVILGYWEKDPKQREHVAEMLGILESIRPLAARR
jgi:hypothetical protein